MDCIIRATNFIQGHAELSGFRHVRTFDGKTYGYKSSCQSKHLLVRDTKYNDFTVVVTYGSTPAITITTIDPVEGEQVVELAADYSVSDERGRRMAATGQQGCHTRSFAIRCMLLVV